jgi:hypothetical protein
VEAFSARPSPWRTSWWRNAANVAAHHANVLLELWLAGAPVHEVRVLLLSLAHDLQHQAVIEECWHARGAERRQTVPSKIKRKLCRLAVAHVTELRRQRIINQWVQATVRDLRRQGYSDPSTEIMSRPVLPPVHIDPPPLEKARTCRPACASGYAPKKSARPNFTQINYRSAGLRPQAHDTLACKTSM